MKSTVKGNDALVNAFIYKHVHYGGTLSRLVYLFRELLLSQLILNTMLN